MGFPPALPSMYVGLQSMSNAYESQLWDVTAVNVTVAETTTTTYHFNLMKTSSWMTTIKTTGKYEV